MALVETSRPEPAWSSKPATPERLATPPRVHSENGDVAQGAVPVDHASEALERAGHHETAPAVVEDVQESESHALEAARHFVGDGKSWVTVSGARLRLLDVGGARGSEEHSPALPSHLEADAPADVCSCGAEFLPDADFCRKCGAPRLAARCSCGALFELDAEFCRKCGAKRHVAGASNASNTVASSSILTSSVGGTPQRHGRALVRHVGAGVELMGRKSQGASPERHVPESNGHFGLPSWQERIKTEYQDLTRAVLAEQASEAQTEARLDAELSELKNRSTEEAHAINGICQQICDAAFVKDELCHMDEERQLLHDELLSEENHRHVWEAEIRSEEEDLRARLQARQQQLSEMAANRRSMNLHLERMASTQSWLRGDIEEIRRTRTSIEVTGQRELELRSEEIERVNNELHVLIQEHRSDHDTWRAQAESEVFRLRQESKRQHLEETQLVQSIERAQSEHAEMTSQLREDVDSSAHRKVVLEEEIAQALKDCKRQAELDRPQCVTDVSRLEVECQAEEKKRDECLSELASDEALCAQAQIRTYEQRRWIDEQAEKPTLTKEDRQIARQGLREKELEVLRQQVQQVESRQAILREDLQHAESSKGIFNCARRRPPLPPPRSEP